MLIDAVYPHFLDSNHARTSFFVKKGRVCVNYVKNVVLLAG